MDFPTHQRHAAVATNWGIVRLGWSDIGLASVRLPDPAAPPDEPEPSDVPVDIAGWANLLRAYFAGEAVDFGGVALDDGDLGDSDRAIYAALRAVPRGETVTYGQLAARIGKPGAARAVGVAMARNRWPIVVPCHRVLATDGTLGGFSAPGGVATKRRLLAMEGVDLDRGMPMLPGLFD